MLLKRDITPIADTSRYVATHGSPWDYDRRVPILFWRHGPARAAPSDAPSRPTDIMPTLAAMIGLAVAARLDRRPLPGERALPACACPRYAKHLKTRLFFHRPFRHEGHRLRGKGACAPLERVAMRKRGLALRWRPASPLSACVQTRQYADVQFTPPQGDYKLLVLRPDVTVGSLTTGGMVEPRADWTDQARANIVAALRAQQAARGGKVTILEHRNELPGVTEQELADVERLNFAVDQSIVLHKYLGDYLPTKRGKGLDWTLGEDAVAARPEDRLRLCLVPPRRGRGRLGRPDRARRARRSPAASSAFARPTSAAQQQLDYASLVDLKTGEVVWFNVVQAGSQVPGIKFGDLRTPQGAAQMVDRLLGRMKPGRRRAASGGGGALMCVRCLELTRRSLLVGGGRCRGRAAHRRRPGAHPAAGHGPAGRPRLPPDRRATRSACGSRWSGSRRRSPAPTC